MQIKTPDIGVDKATVAEILVKVGDSVAVDDSLILLESDKASVEVPSTSAGVVKSILVQLGDDVFTHHRGDFGVLVDMLTGLIDHPTGIGVAQPAGHGGHVIQALAGGDSGHGAAVGMPADHDVADLQGGDGVFHRGGYPAGLRPV